MYIIIIIIVIIELLLLLLFILEDIKEWLKRCRFIINGKILKKIIVGINLIYLLCHASQVTIVIIVTTYYFCDGDRW